MFPIHDDTERIHGRPYLNYALIAANIAVFAWQISVDHNCIWQCTNENLTLVFGFTPSSLVDQPGLAFATMMTGMFMHAGLLHIGGNMLFLYVFGDNIEDKFGRLNYLLAYFGWGIAAALAHGAFALATGSADIPAVGASGAISGILGAYLVMFPRAGILTFIMAFFVMVRRISAMWYIPIWFAMQIVFAVIGQLGPSGSSGVAYMAHIGGFVAGLGTGLAVKAFAKPTLAPSKIPGRPFSLRNPMAKKSRPKIEDLAPNVPEVIEGSDYYEVIAEVRGVGDASDIAAQYEPESRQVRITTSGPRKYDLLARLPDSAVNPTVSYIHYLNGIARIRLQK